KDDEVTVKINGTDYKYKIVASDTFDNVVKALVASINGANDGKGDTNVLAIPNLTTSTLVLSAKAGGSDGNAVTLATTVSTNGTIVATASGATLTGGYDAAKIAPGTIVSVLGDGLSEDTASAATDKQELPTTLAN